MAEKQKIFNFFPKNWHFRPKLFFFLAKTASKHLILGETDQRKWLQKSWGLYEVTEKSYDQKTKNFHFGRNVNSSFTYNFFRWSPGALNSFAVAFLVFFTQNKLFLDFLDIQRFVRPKKKNCQKWKKWRLGVKLQTFF